MRTPRVVSWLALALALALSACEPSAGAPATPTAAGAAASAPSADRPSPPAPASAARPAGGTPAPSPSPTPAAGAPHTAPAEAPLAAPAAVPPAATPRPAAPAVATPAFSGQRALADVRWLAEEIGSRPAGSEAERRAAERLRAKLAELGYEAQLQVFAIQRFEDRGARVRFAEEPSLAPVGQALQYSAGGTVRGRLVDAGLGRREDLAQRDLRGAVALIARGQITFGEKVRNVAAAGAVGALIYNQDTGLFQGTLAGPAPIPVVALGGADGRRLAERLDRGPLTAELVVDAAVVRATSQNVVAALPRPGASVVVLGAHYDSVPDGPGANDNASGTATVLELARALAANRPPFTVRVVLFGAEEIGLVGSRHYVAALPPAERARIVAMLNADMVGVGDRPMVSGSAELVDLAHATAARLEMRLAGHTSGRGRFSSDHAAFIEAGIPALFFYRSEDPRYHTADDRAQYVEAGHLEATGRLALTLLERLAAR